MGIASLFNVLVEFVLLLAKRCDQLLRAEHLLGERTKFCVLAEFCNDVANHCVL